MGYDIDILLKTDLYKDLSMEQLKSITDKNYGQFKSYKKNDRIFNEGDKPSRILMLISGSVTIARETYTGGRVLISHIREKGSLFGEVYTFMKQPEYRVYAEASEDTVVFSMSDSIITSSELDEEISTIIRNNLLNIFAHKAYTMNSRLLVLGASSLREKIARFLLQHQTSEGKLYVCMTREEMADYLNVTRPSLSRELGNMTKEGILDLDGRKIIIKDQQRLEELV